MFPMESPKRQETLEIDEVDQAGNVTTTYIQTVGPQGARIDIVVGSSLYFKESRVALKFFLEISRFEIQGSLVLYKQGVGFANWSHGVSYG